MPPQAIKQQMQRIKNMPVKYRISKNHGRLMVLVALFFDLLPLLLIVGAATLILTTLGGADSCTQAANDVLMKGESKLGNWWDIGWCAVSTGASMFIAGVVVGPALYLIGSILSVSFAFLFFLAWFLAKKVNPLAPTPRHMAANLLAFIFESIPFLNIVPTITIATRMHVKSAQKEDEEKHKEKAQKMIVELKREYALSSS